MTTRWISVSLGQGRRGLTLQNGTDRKILLHLGADGPMAEQNSLHIQPDAQWDSSDFDFTHGGAVLSIALADDVVPAADTALEMWMCRALAAEQQLTRLRRTFGAVVEILSSQLAADDDDDGGSDADLE